MAGTKNALRTARVAVVALSLLLAVGAVGCWVLASKTIQQNRDEIIASASTVTDNTIANVITGQDLAVPVTTARANEIDEALQTSGFGSTGFQNVTIWRIDGQVVYANQQKLLGARLPTEVTHLRSVIKDGASSQIKEGIFQVYVPYITNGTDAVIELDRPDAPIVATATPLRAASGMLAFFFLATLFVLMRLSHAISSAAANQAFRPTQTQGLGQVSQAPDADAPTRSRRGEQAAAAQAGYREEAEARRRAEDRAHALEEQVSLLQEQYRNSLTELQTTQKKLQEAVTNAAGPRGDKAAEERLLKAEGRARLLEGQLSAMSQEREKMATQLTEAREDAARVAAPDPEVERRIQQLGQESLALRAELEGTKTELDVAKRELATNQTRAKDLEAEIAGLGNVERDAAQQREELQRVAAEADLLRGELEGLRGGAEEAQVLRGQLDELRGQLEQLLPHAEAARTLRVELDEVAAARTAAEEARASTQQQLDAVSAELETARNEAAEASARHDDVAADRDRVRDELETTSATLTAEREAAEALRAEVAAAEAAASAAEQGATQERERLAAEHAEALAAKEREAAERVEAARAELRVEFESLEADLRAGLETTATELAGDLRRTQEELAAAQARAEETAGELERSTSALEEARALVATGDELARSHAEELEAVRAELLAAHERADQRGSAAEATAAELDELRTQLHVAVDELEALRAAKSGDENALAHAQADAQGSRRELDAALARLEETERERDTARAELEATASVSGAELVAAHDEITATAAARDAALAELDAIRSQVDGAEDEAIVWRTRLAELEGELETNRTELETNRMELETNRTDLESVRAELANAHAEIQTELARGVEVAGRAEQAEQELAILRDQQIAAAADEDGTELEEIARVAQERLASQTDKLTETEDRAHAAEQQLEQALGRLSELEEALRQAAEGSPVAASAAEGAEPIEDRRAATPFTKELSLDAKKTLTQILGITLTLKHKKSAQEQAPFLRQLSAMAKRLDRTVSDLAEAEKLAHGEIELNVRRTNLEALVERVVEESGVGGEHEVRLETEELVVGVDPLRAEQILNGLLRSSADRTSPGSQITVRLQHENEGALLSVEDKEASSDGSLSPVVARLADVMGGWAKVESRPSGGSAFRVYLPDQSGAGVKTTAKPEDTLQITVENPTAEEAPAEPVDFSEVGDDDPWAAGQLLVQELQRLSHQEGK